VKLTLPADQACAMVLDSLLKQLDRQWPDILGNLVPLLKEARVYPKVNEQMAKFNFTLALIAVNIRATFDVFPREMGTLLTERMFSLLRDSFHKDFPLVQSSILKFIEAYDMGILRIHNPLLDLGMLLYYKIGLENTEQKVVDEEYYAPDPSVVDYLSHVLMMYAGKWEFLIQRYEIVGFTGHSTDNETGKPSQ
jgi:hypothetical protein